MFKYVAVATVLLVFAGPVCAGTPGLDQRQQNQAQRIRQGVHSGALTRPAAASGRRREPADLPAEARRPATRPSGKRGLSPLQQRH